MDYTLTSDLVCSLFYILLATDTILLI